jgi:hypothetical protein
MATTKSRAKAGARTKGKSGRRTPVKVKRGSDVPILPIAVGGVLGLLLIGMIVYILYLNRPAPGPAAAGGIPCDQLEHTQTHYHAALQIMYHGISTNLPDNTGINFTDSTQSAVSCYYWLHVHASQKNIIHIESPANQTFTLGQFFQVWDTWSKANGKGSQQLDSTHVSQFTLAPTDKMVIYVDKGDGKGAQVYAGDPKAIVLVSHEVITIEITPPDVKPPPAFTFPSGL